MTAATPDFALSGLRGMCAGIKLVEVGVVSPENWDGLTEWERSRIGPMGRKRCLEYCAARLALKRLAGELTGGSADVPDCQIETVGPDGVRPCCDFAGAPDSLHVSASHDRRYAVAVASLESRIGVDVEEATDRVARCSKAFLAREEDPIVDGSDLGRLAGLTRIWSIKEAAAKAVDMSLPDSWVRTRVVSLGETSSTARIDGETSNAGHCMVDSHLLTVLTLSKT